ncbi:MAG: hypothetical protein DDT30_01864 [Dehalococcoidia bacterium]|nr:hypothetical protein [Bacillota bacterium]
MKGQRVLGAAVDVALPRSDSIGGNHHPFQHTVRITFADAAVHECTGITLIRVTGHVLHLSGSAVSKLPLQAGEEPRTTTPTQARAFDLFDDFFRSHFKDGLPQSLIPTASDIFLDVLRVDHAAVAQDNALLLGVERDLAVVRHGPMGHRLFICKGFHHPAFNKGLLHQAGNILFADLAIKDALRIDDHHRAHLAESAATGEDYPHLVFETTAGNLRLQGLECPGRSRCNTPGASAYQGICPVKSSSHQITSVQYRCL